MFSWRKKEKYYVDTRAPIQSVQKYFSFEFLKISIKIEAKGVKILKEFR